MIFNMITLIIIKQKKGAEEDVERLQLNVVSTPIAQNLSKFQANLLLFWYVSPSPPPYN